VLGPATSRLVVYVYERQIANALIEGRWGRMGVWRVQHPKAAFLFVPHLSHEKEAMEMTEYGKHGKP
jgi:hypothetical protein